MQASAVSLKEPISQQGPNSTALKSILTESYLLQFAADNSKGVLAAVSMDVKLYGTTARHICQVRVTGLLTSNASSNYAHLYDDTNRGSPAHCSNKWPSFHGQLYELVLQTILEAFVKENSSFLARKNPTTCVKGFSTSLYHAYRQVPQYIASAIAAKAAPMQLLWVITAQSDALLK